MFLFFNVQIIFVLCFICVFAKTELDCGSHVECGSCLQQRGCVWCLSPEMKNSSSTHKNSVLNHCISLHSDQIICQSTDLINPETRQEKIEDRPLQNKIGEIVQMKPQRMRVTLRVGEEQDIDFQYSQADNYPVDLYYIIDNSHSMRIHKEKLAELATKLTETMSSITNDFRIGFGSFIDKVDMPYVSTSPKRLKHPCGQEYACISPYSFKNHVPLTKDFDKFVKEVGYANFSTSLDSPEGGFDAIMQAIVCKEEIGWRPLARHFIIFSTDGLYHSAGDGKLAGIIETNDAKCHLKNNNYDGLAHDYPSVSQLNHVAKENNVNLIFAVAATTEPYIRRSYKMLSGQIENSRSDNLDDASKNVVKLVVENYKKVVNQVTIETVNVTENIQVKITSDCRYPIKDGCSQIHNRDVVNFKATIELLKCEDGVRGPTTISLKPRTLNESLVIELKTICECDCQSPQHKSYKANSTDCAGAGNLVCGICMCNENRHGRKCECDKEDSQMFNGTSTCRENKPGALVCSGLGSCKCGKCECKTNPNTGNKYRGQFCECDDDSCPRENGILCGLRGTCSCGTCICDAGWSGNSCGCQDNNAMCVREGDNNICSGKGSCSCGKCLCDDMYTGTYCEVCHTCSDKCESIKDCVECTVFQTGSYDHNECKLNCVALDISTTNEIVREQDEEDKICRVIDSSRKCEMIYKYKYNDVQNLVITVRKEKNCELNLLVWSLSVVGAIVLIGIVTLLIWKIVTMIHDQREYNTFMEEQKRLRWNESENPLYLRATTTFNNPYYSKNSRHSRHSRHSRNSTKEA